MGLEDLRLGFVRMASHNYAAGSRTAVVRQTARDDLKSLAHRPVGVPSERERRDTRTACHARSLGFYLHGSSCLTRIQAPTWGTGGCPRWFWTSPSSGRDA